MISNIYCYIFFTLPVFPDKQCVSGNSNKRPFLKVGRHLFNNFTSLGWALIRGNTVHKFALNVSFKQAD